MISAIEQTLAEPTVAAAFLRTAAANEQRIALREFGSADTLTYGEWRARARAVAGGLEQLGVERGDRVALLLSNRLEFHIVDVGAMLLGAASFSLYNTAPLEQLLYYADNAEPRVIVAEPELAHGARELIKLRPQVQLVVLERADHAAGEMTLAELEASCPDDFDLEATVRRIAPGDLLTLVYTSGTTGPPKGVQYVHAGVMFTLRTFNARLPVSAEGRNISYLPMAHIAERLLGHYAGFGYGYTITSLPDPKHLQAALLHVRPTRFFGVPRIYEKVEATMLKEDHPGRAAQGRRPAGGARGRRATGARRAGRRNTAARPGARRAAAAPAGGSHRPRQGRVARRLRRTVRPRADGALPRRRPAHE